MTKHADSNLIVIYQGEPVNAEMVCNILNDNGIEARMNNQLMGSIAPYMTTAGGAQPVEVYVLEEDKEKALQWVAEFEKS